MAANRKKAVKRMKDLAVLIFGNLLLAFLVNTFVIPSNIIMGGATGVGIVLTGVIPALDTATIVLIFNILMLLLGAVVL